MIINRIAPVAAPRAYRTFQVVAPRDVMLRATCREVGCQAYARGWRSTFDEATTLGAAQADYVRRRSGRDFRESRTAAGLTVFTFSAFQRCFADHKTRSEIYTVFVGDWRGLAGPVITHTGPRPWVDQFAEHQGRIAEARRRG